MIKSATNEKHGFKFNVPLVKAYKDTKGKMRVVGQVSDNLQDVQGDSMSVTAIRSMSRQAKERGLPLLDNHRATFGFGHTADASIHEDGETKSLLFDFELDDSWPQSHALFREVTAAQTAGKAPDSQLSIGGRINMDNPNAVSWKKTPNGGLSRIVNDIELDHVATTRKGMAANERTGFVSAVIKALDDDEDVPVRETRLPITKTVASAAALVGGHEIPAPERVAAAARLMKEYTDHGKTPPPSLVTLSKGADVNLTFEVFKTEHLALGVPASEIITKEEWSTIMADKKVETPAAKSDEPAAGAGAGAQDPNQGNPGGSDADKNGNGEGDAAADAEKGLTLLARIGRMFGRGAAQPEKGKPTEPEVVLTDTMDLATLKSLVNDPEKGALAKSRLAELLGLSPAVAATTTAPAPADPPPATPPEKEAPATPPALTKDELTANLEPLTKGLEAVNTLVKTVQDAVAAMELRLKSLEDAGKVSAEEKGKLDVQLKDITASVTLVSKEAAQRLEVLEKAGGISQSQPPASGDDDVIDGGGAPAGGGEVEKSRDPFKGIFTPILAQVNVGHVPRRRS